MAARFDSCQRVRSTVGLSLDRLGDDLLQNVCRYLDAKSLLSMHFASRTCNQCARPIFGEIAWQASNVGLSALLVHAEGRIEAVESQASSCADPKAARSVLEGTLVVLNQASDNAHFRHAACLGRKLFVASRIILGRAAHITLLCGTLTAMALAHIGCYDEAVLLKRESP